MAAIHPTRRDFLHAGAVAAVGMAARPQALVARERGPYDGFTVGIQSYCFRNFAADAMLQRIHDLGLHWLEVFEKHLSPESPPEKVHALVKLCRSYSVTPVAFGVQSFNKDQDRSRRLFDFARELGVKVMTADPSPDSLDSLDRLVEEYKIGIAIHPHGPLPVVNRLHRWYSADIILQAVRHHHPLIGSCLDTGHLIRAAQLGKHLDPAEQIRKMGARNLALHLKDHDNRAREDVVYGKGELDVPAVLRALRDVKFKGHISVEYEAHPDNPSPDIRACLDVLQQSIRTLG